MVGNLLEDGQLRDNLGLVVSHTTRTRREGEVDGVHYHFTTRDEMERHIDNGAFLEFAEVHGQLYGTSFSAIDAVGDAGKVCILDIDLQGVHNLRKYLDRPDVAMKARFVFVKPPGGLATLEERLRNRDTEDEEKRKRRLDTARSELNEFETVPWEWDEVVVNCDLATSCKVLRETTLGLCGAEVVIDPSAGSGTAAGMSSPEPSSSSSSKNVFTEFSELARSLGDDCVDLGQGFPNFDPPEFVKQALRQELFYTEPGLKTRRQQYTRTAGNPELVEVIASRYGHHFKREIACMHEVAVTVGATNGLYLILHAVLNRPGPRRPDEWEVVVLEPFFGLYRSQVTALGGVLRCVPLSYDESTQSFALDEKALSAALGPQTAAIIVNTPHNPTGKIFTRSELEIIADLVRRHPDIVVISDEVYKYMIFDPPREASSTTVGGDEPEGHVHFASLPGMWDQTVTVSSAGKTFGITGWQVGWVVGPTKWLAPIQRFMPNLQFCAPTPMQNALCKVLARAGEPFSGHLSYYSWLRQGYADRRKRMVSALEIVGIKTVASASGFFLLADVGCLCGPEGPFGAEAWSRCVQEHPDEERDWTFCRLLASELGIVSLPVSPFFSPNAPDNLRSRFVRLCFAKTDDTLDEATRRFRKLAAAMPMRLRTATA